jgi:hypothetical protein
MDKLREKALKLKFTHQMRQTILTACMESSEDVLKDVVSEIITELTSDRYTTNDERVVGMLEALEFVLNIDIIN